MTQNSTKIQGKFYPLTPELAHKLREAKLTAAEWRFWAYLVEIDPYGDRYHDLDPVTIQTECEISKPTYYRAKAKFQELEIFDFQEEKVSFRNLTGVSKMRLESQKRDSKSQKRDSKSQKRDSKSQKREKSASKPASGKDSSTPQKDQTYSDFKDSLSEEERANFLEFCKEKIKNLSQEVNDIEAWLAHKNKAGRNRWEVYYEKFVLASQQKKNQSEQEKKQLDKRERARREFAEWQQELEERRLRGERAGKLSQAQKQSSGGKT
ncbi:MAG: hypothetical protein QNJ51_23110 [Calothrix sp. MO_167.B12]|nr:hypothetical protein [Calothrix sp. MO_167.B12]